MEQQKHKKEFAILLYNDLSHQNHLCLPNPLFIVKHKDIFIELYLKYYRHNYKRLNNAEYIYYTYLFRNLLYLDDWDLNDMLKY
uniref:Uncharacterized protein n=1 Tax=viral metagenome TaxID=1070528 RepID=A0A6C0CTK1_9ZZZZ